jgi:hypothetical protein
VVITVSQPSSVRHTAENTITDPLAHPVLV